MLPPALDQHLGLGQRVEHLCVEEFVPQLAVETLHVAGDCQEFRVGQSG